MGFDDSTGTTSADSGRWDADRPEVGPNVLPAIVTTTAHFGKAGAVGASPGEGFSQPGPGRGLLDSIQNRDFIELDAQILVLALAFIGGNLVADLFAAAVDRRITSAWYDPDYGPRFSGPRPRPRFRHLRPGGSNLSPKGHRGFGLLGNTGMAIWAVFVFAAIFGPTIVSSSPTAPTGAAPFLRPYAKFLFGTDDLGRSEFSRIVVAARVAILASVESTAFALALGTILGVVAGYVGGLVDGVISRVMDFLFSFPTYLLRPYSSSSSARG
jgi:ABC-type antimicrobial peptide transport system permease subunit